MARRSLPKIRGDLDLSRYFKLMAELDGPDSIAALFDRPAPLELEIGSGKGLFIRKAARQFPEHNFLGIEISYRYALSSAAGLCRQDLNDCQDINGDEGEKIPLINAVMVNGDAAKVLAEQVAADSLEAVHVYFPDPWWKKAHRPRRILRKDVLQLIEKCLRPGGTLHFWTDVEEYYLSTLEIIAAETGLIGPNYVPEPEALDDMDYRTHFERRTRLNHLPVYRSYFNKKI